MSRYRMYPPHAPLHPKVPPSAGPWVEDAQTAALWPHTPAHQPQGPAPTMSGPATQPLPAITPPAGARPERGDGQRRLVRSRLLRLVLVLTGMLAAAAAIWAAVFLAVAEGWWAP